MHTLYVRNVNEALDRGSEYLALNGHNRTSRNGVTVELDSPLATVYSHPQERVLFNPDRNANPFFHLFEALWMLAGRKDVDWLARFNPRMAQYSDNGQVLHGAYGYRWRRHWNHDQLLSLTDQLRSDPGTRRAVLTMWDPATDMDGGKDLPCNMLVTFSRRRFLGEDTLDMVTVARSNDMVWGAYGANAVHLSLLQEWLAGAVGCHVGTWHQMSHNFHAYVDTWTTSTRYMDQQEYQGGTVAPYPLGVDGANYGRWLETAENWVAWVGTDLRWTETSSKLGEVQWGEPWFDDVASPLYRAWRYWKRRQWNAAQEELERCAATDWRLAASVYLRRAHQRWQATHP